MLQQGLKKGTEPPRSRRRLLTILIIAAGIPLGVLLGGTIQFVTLNGGCPLQKALTIQEDQMRFSEVHGKVSAGLTVLASDPKLDIVQISSPERAFWIKRAGESMPGKELLAYLLTEHQWMAELNPDKVVRAGDTVIDCGAHVGVFARFAFRRGARRVVAVEPEPINLECLRRNFRDEIADGRLIIVPQGVWSAPGTMSLYLGTPNSGMNTMVFASEGQQIQVPTTTIDLLVSQLGLSKVDYIKMDIEGAEREALRGALETLRRFRPVLMLDSYHRPDDMTVLPRVIRAAHDDYSFACGACEFQHGKLVPHVTFYR